MKTNRLVTALGLSAALVLAGVAPAMATTTYPSVGGIWSHAVNSTEVYSYYYHGNRVHRSSVQTSVAYEGSAWMPIQTWSKADLPATVFNNNAYYDVQ